MCGVRKIRQTRRATSPPLKHTPVTPLFVVVASTRIRTPAGLDIVDQTGTRQHRPPSPGKSQTRTPHRTPPLTMPLTPPPDMGSGKKKTQVAAAQQVAHTESLQVMSKRLAELYSEMGLPVGAAGGMPGAK